MIYSLLLQQWPALFLQIDKSFFSFTQDRKRGNQKHRMRKEIPCLCRQLAHCFEQNYRQIIFIAFCKLRRILGFSVLSIILADLLGNRCSFQRVQMVTIFNLELVDFDPFIYNSRLVARERSTVSGNYRLVCCGSDLSYEMSSST